jgi:hypothetical protein
MAVKPDLTYQAKDIIHGKTEIFRGMYLQDGKILREPGNRENGRNSFKIGSVYP